MTASKKSWACFVDTRNALRQTPSAPDASAKFQECTADPLLTQSQQELQLFVDQGVKVTGETKEEVLTAKVTKVSPPTVQLTACVDNTTFALIDKTGSPVPVPGVSKSIAVVTVQRFDQANEPFLVQSLQDAPGRPPC